MIKIDASALIYAVKGNYHGILRKLYGEIIIIDTIHEETVIKGITREKRDAYVLEKLIEDEVFIRHSDSENSLVTALGKGELAVIQSALEEKCMVLIDDHRARKFAIQRGLKVQWTTLAFLRALKQKIITEKEFNKYLTKYTAIASPSMLEYLLILEMKELIL